MKAPKSMSDRPAPERFPIMGPLGQPKDEQRFIPGALLDNEHCKSSLGYGLATIAERGGMGPEEVAGNLRRMTRDEIMALERDDAWAIIDAAIARHRKSAKE